MSLEQDTAEIKKLVEQDIFKAPSPENLQNRHIEQARREAEAEERIKQERLEREERARVAAIEGLGKMKRVMEILGMVKVVVNPYHWSTNELVHGTNADGETISLHLAGDRIGVSGTNYPMSKTYRENDHAVYNAQDVTIPAPSISISSAKTPEQIAKDIQRRFLTSHKEYHTASKKKAQDRDAHEDLTVKSLQAVKGKPLDDYEISRKKLTVSPKHGGVYAYVEANGAHINMTISGVTPEQAVAIRKILNQRSPRVTEAYEEAGSMELEDLTVEQAKEIVDIINGGEMVQENVITESITRRLSALLEAKPVFKAATPANIQARKPPPPKPIRITKYNIPVYDYDSLSDRAKDKARDEYLSHGYESFAWDDTKEDAEQVGLELQGTHQGRMTGNFKEYTEDCAKKIIANHGDMTETYKTAKKFLDELALIGDEEHYEAEHRTPTGNYKVSYDDAIKDLKADFLKELCEDYRIMYEKNEEYQSSEEAIAETFRANEYEFTEDGKMFKAHPSWTVAERKLHEQDIFKAASPENLKKRRDTIKNRYSHIHIQDEQTVPLLTYGELTEEEKLEMQYNTQGHNFFRYEGEAFDLDQFIATSGELDDLGWQGVSSMTYSSGYVAKNLNGSTVTVAWMWQSS